MSLTFVSVDVLMWFCPTDCSLCRRTCVGTPCLVAAIAHQPRAHGGQLRLVPIDRGFGVELELGRRDPSQPGTTG